MPNLPPVCLCCHTLNDHSFNRWYSTLLLCLLLAMLPGFAPLNFFSRHSMLAHGTSSETRSSVHSTVKAIIDLTRYDENASTISHTSQARRGRGRPLDDTSNITTAIPEELHAAKRARGASPGSSTRLSRYWNASKARNSSNNVESIVELRESSVTSDRTISGQDVIDLIDESEDDDVHFISVRKLKAQTKHEQIPAIPRILPPPQLFPIRAVTINRVRIKVEDTVEFRDGSFMKIHSILRDHDEHRLIGRIFTRVGCTSLTMPTRRDGLDWQSRSSNWGRDTRHTANRRIPEYYRGKQLLNEVVQRVRVVQGEHEQDRGLWKRRASNVLRTRILRLTNQSYDELNCITQDQLHLFKTSRSRVREEGILTCRWVEAIHHNANGRWKQECLEHPAAAVVDREWQASNARLRREWRGEETPRPESQQYTFADSFCGAGGVSMGAEQAGVRLLLSFDIDQSKIMTYRANFPNAKSLVMDVHDFISKARQKGWKVDILHISPPCQPFSIANTRPNELKNERNQPPILACAELIRALRPRVVTVEEAPGLIQRHMPWFDALIHQFTELGFSVHWSQLNCAEYGVPQSRKRLFIIAAAPGETLPGFPLPTHTVGDVTIASTLAHVEAAHRDRPLSYHEPKNFPKPKFPFDPHSLAATVTCGGGQNYHPSGLRNYTPREYLAIQTFPIRFKLGAKADGSKLTNGEVILQCGNAVPPAVMRAIQSSIIQSLRRTDRKRREDLGRIDWNQPIVLD